MSFASIFTHQTRDDDLDHVFNSSAGPSTVQKASASTTANASARPLPPPSKAEISVVEATATSAKKRKRTTAEIPSSHRKKAVPERKPDNVDSSSDVSPDDSADGEIPQHETVSASKNKERTLRKVRYAPEDETPEARDARTIFLGNLPVSIVKSKPLQKQLRRHVLSVVPMAKIESVRFRSVAFLNPTTKLEEEGGEGQSKSKGRQQKRAAEWKEHHQQEAASLKGSSKREQEENAEDKKGEKQYMAPAEKRRLAAIRGEVHNEAVATTNAYIVFAYAEPKTDGEPDSTQESMDPSVAAREAVEKLDGSVFAEHAIRADRVGNGQAKGPGNSMTDPKLSIFIGNLDFASSEDDLRAYFESIVKEERGPRSSKRTASEASHEHPGVAWVTRVRIVRDKDTQLGKGFAYVQFSDRDCVDAVLSMDSEKLAFAKRPLRVQRCKAVTNKDSVSKAQARQKASPLMKGSGASMDTVIPKGDPLLGSRLAGLSKDERRAAKAHDADRVARRLAKKKARNAMQKSESIAAGTKSGRTRVRDKKSTKINPGRKEGKRRVRSERSIDRRNIKK